MKKKSVYIVSLFGLGCLLAACQNQEVSTNYFLQHPRELQTQLQVCQEKITSDDAGFTAKCKSAVAAQLILRGYLQEAQSSPEQFGQRILDTEYTLSLIDEKIIDKEREFNQNKGGNAALAALRLEIDQLKIARHEKNEQVKDLLAVAGLNSPE